MEKRENWVETWGMAHVHLSLMSFLSRKRTLRLVFNSAISGKRVRIRLCNQYSGSAVVLGRANAALCGRNGKISDAQSVRQITWGGQKGLTLRPGEKAVSDETDLTVPAGAYMCLDLYVEKGRLKSGNCLNNVRLLCAPGNLSGNPVIRNKKRIRDLIISIAGKLLGLALHSPIPLFQAAEFLNDDGASSIECFGDSLTQQGFWTNPFEEKIRALYPGRYSVINKGIGGNRILRDTGKRFPLRGFFGTKALERVQDDIFAFDGISHVIFCMGINDFFQPGTIAAHKNEYVTAEEIAAGAGKLAAMFRDRGMTLVGLNYIPVGMSRDATSGKNALLAQLNEWFQDCGAFDFSFDIYSAFVSPENADLPVASYLGNDRLHPNGDGGRAIAEAIDCNVFG